MKVKIKFLQVKEKIEVKVEIILHNRQHNYLFENFSEYLLFKKEIYDRKNTPPFWIQHFDFHCSEFLFETF